MKAWRLKHAAMHPCNEKDGEYLITATWPGRDALREVWDWENIPAAVFRLLLEGDAIPKITIQPLTPELLVESIRKVCP